MRTVDLFAGCGGLSLGFENAGFNVVAAFDYWHPAIQVYKENFQHPIFEKDLSQADICSFISDFSPDIIIGRDTAVPCPLYLPSPLYYSGAAGIDINSPFSKS